MAIRLPLKTVLDVNNDAPGHGGPSSTAGGVAHTFTIPQDTDNIVLKLQSSVVGGGMDATLQTTDDGGSTWYDLGRTSTVSNANGTTAQWLSVPVEGFGFRSATQAQTSVLGSTNVGVALNTIGSAAASSLGQSQNSGLPVLSPLGRVFLRYTAAVSSIQSERVKVLVNSQSDN